MNFTPKNIFPSTLTKKTNKKKNSILSFFLIIIYFFNLAGALQTEETKVKDQGPCPLVQLRH